MGPLDALKRELELRPEIRLAVLFGSWARGTARASSDIDIGLRLSPDSLELRREIELALARAARAQVDIVYLDEAPPQLRMEITCDGVMLVQREEGSWADFRARSMIDWWDWAPLARRIHAAAARRLQEQVSRGPV